MGHSIIPAENLENHRECCTKKMVVQKDDPVQVLELSAEDSRIVVETMLRPPRRSSILARDFTRYRKSVISE